MHRRILMLLCLFPLLASVAFGQSVTGSLLGTVSDATGAIPGAVVVVTSQDTGMKSTVKADPSGDYEATNLTAGLYRISVNAPGYKTIEIRNIRLLLNQHLRNNVTMIPGGFTEVVEVRGSQGEVQSDSPSIATVTDSHTLLSIPTNGRTIGAVIATVPGNTGEASDSNPKIAGSQHWGGTSFQVNGVSYNDLGNGGGSYAYSTSLTTQPSLDAIQEVKIESNSAKAEYASSVAVTMTTKGGTNQFHGTLFEFNRNTVVAANSYFAKQAGTARLPYNRNEFGGTVGGPIYRNHTFFFFSYERFSQRQSKQAYFTVPTDDQRSGVFTTTIKNPATGLPFANNTIPSTEFDPRTLAILQYVPHGNTIYRSYNLSEAEPTQLDLNRYSGKLDHVFNAKNHLTLDFNWAQSGKYIVNLGYPQEYGNYSDAGFKTKSAAATYTSVLSASKTNEFRISYYTMTSTRLGENTDFDGTTLFPGLYPHAIGGLPIFSMTNYTRIGDSGGSRANPQITEQYGDTFTWKRGKHLIKAGADLQVSRVSTNPSSGTTTLGYFNFNTRYTGNSFANALLGLPSSALRSDTTPPNVIHQNRYGFYVQDDWTLMPRLTFYIGLRYELQPDPTERDGQWTNFDYATGSLVVRSKDHQLPSTAVPDLLALYPPKYSEDVGWGSDVLVSDKKNFAPRFGFSFRPFRDDRVVVRGGFGIFYNMPAIYQGIYQLGISNPPYRITQEYDSGATTPTVTLSNPFAVTPFITANPVLYSVDRVLHNTYSEQRNLSVENRLPGGIGLRISYVGNTAVHAPYVNYNMNQPVTQQSAATDQALRPYQPYGAINGMRFTGSSSTNQLQVEGTKRFQKSLFVQTNLSWTKGIDNVPETGSPQDPYNPSGDRGNADGVRRFTFNFVAGYDLPFGVGRSFLNHRGVVSTLVGGWRVSTITQLQSGAPFSVTYTSSTVGWYATRANVVPGVHLYPGSRTKTAWFNPAAFATPTPYTYGNSTRNMLFGPGEELVNMNLVKVTPLFRDVKLELRVDAFNLPNRAIFANPASSIITPSTMGVISATVSDPRELQIGAKLQF